jgi:PKHD-type hydroxylase
MMLHVPGVLPAETIARCRGAFETQAWVDGRVTAGHQAARAKRNLQLPEEAPESREMTGLVLQALERNQLYFSAVLPSRYSQILFNRYEREMQFAAHVDNAVRPILGGGARIRTDVSATLFIAEPDEYEGGELVVEDVYGSHEVKLPAGDLIVYPSTSVHHVRPVTAGARQVCVFWVQSLVRDVTQRSLLFDLDMAIQNLSKTNPDHPSLVMFTATYHNLLRQWVET